MKSVASIVIAWSTLVVAGAAAAEPRADHDAPGPVVLHVASDGDDTWSGTLATPNAGRTDGPFATIDRARRAVRARRAAGGPPAGVRVEIHAGTHFLTTPLRFGPDDSGAAPPRDGWNRQTGPEHAVVYAAAAGERPVVSGGRRITGWAKGEVAGREAWTVDLPEVREGRWHFTQLWVDGRRAARPRLPRAGPEKFGRNATYRIAAPLGLVRFEGSPDETIFTGQDAFRYSGDDLTAFHNLTDVDCVVLHFWVATRIPFDRIEPSSKTATLQRKSRMRLTDDFTKNGAPYYVENVREALDTPGQFYLDRVSGLLTYLPRPGESIDTAEVIAPVLQQVMLVEGDAPRDDQPARSVEWLRFEGLAFSHTEWCPGPEDALTPQAASHVPGAVVFARARHCTLRDCAVTHVGSYGVETRDACSDVEIARNTIADLGAGGVKIWHTETAVGVPETSLQGGSRRITLADNVIADGGHRHHQGVGVLVGRCSGNTIVHNDIHDFDYTGISVGWTWGYEESGAYGNVVERNHVHDIGRGMLSDMGGIYTLGVSPGTRIRHNVFHDIDSRGYGGWGIYTDEGSSGILIESNLVYRTKSQGFHQHYGEGNVVCNNIFAFGGDAAVARSRIEPHDSFTFTGNIVLLDNDGRVLAGDWNETRATFDRNLYFHVGGVERPLDFAVGDRKRGDSFVNWQRRGMDLHSLVADPLMTDPLRGDFQMDPRSPATEKLGFVPWDYGNVGPRPRDAGAAAEFPTPFDSEKDAAAKPLPAAEAAAGFTAADGLDVGVFAAEPEVANPIAMAWDVRGRLWIAENFTYAEPGIRFETRLRDRVVVFTDRDGDGRADGRTVLRDDLTALTSVEVGLGGVWLLCPPQLLFVPDADGDAVPDGPAKVVLDGFDVADQNHHNLANGLRFGPDGWLYGRCGASCPAAVGRPGTPAADRVPVAGGMWRFAPWSGRFEALCHGTTNPWGHDWNAWGDGFFINTVNGHLWQIIPGGHYVRPHTLDPNPHVYELIDMHADHWHFDVAGGWQKSRDGTANDLGGGHAHSGAMIYLGAGWPEEFRGDLFTWNFHGRRLNRERLERHGSGYVARHRPDILLAADPFFRGIELAAGPDGAVYALDWSDTGECHEHTGVHRTSGRIFRIAGRAGRRAAPRPDLATADAAALAALVTHPDEWHVRQARLLLAARAGRGLAGASGPAAPDLAAGHAALRRLVASPDPLVACRAVLTLHAAGGADAALLRDLLAHPDEHLRAWGVRLLVDDWPLDGVTGPLPAAAAEAARVTAAWKAVAPEFLRLATSDSSGLVRLSLASALQRLPVVERPALAAALVQRAEDAADHDLPLLVWYGLIPVVEADPAAAADLALAARWPKTQRLIVRRLAGLVDRKPEAVGRIAAAIAATDDAAVRRNLLAGLVDGLAGWRRAPKPPGWDAVPPAVAADPEAAVVARDLSALFGDGRARDEIVRLVLDGAAETGLRRSALAALVDQGGDLRDVCLPLLVDQRFNVLAAEGLAAVDDPAVATALVNAYGKFRAPDRPRLVAVLCSRPSFAAALLAAIEAGRIRRDALSAYDLRQVRTLGAADVDAALERLYGNVTAASADKRRRIDDLKAALGPDALAVADCRRGRALYEQACSRCHKLFGAGAAIGPDLTGGNRSNLDYLLENIVDPGGVVSRDYRMSVVTLGDGRVVSGLVTARDDRTLTVVTPTDRHVFGLDEVEEVTVTSQSPMPEGLLDPLAPDAIRDLVAYLMQPAQVPLPE